MRTVEFAIVTAMGLALAYVVATAAGRFIEQSFANAAANIRQMK